MMNKKIFCKKSLLVLALILGSAYDASISYAGGTITLPSKPTIFLSSSSRTAPAPTVPATTMIDVLSYGNLSATEASIQAGEGVVCYGTFQGSTVVGTMVSVNNQVPASYACRYVFAGRVLFGHAGSGTFAPKFWLLSKSSYQWLNYRDQYRKVVSVVDLARADTNVTFWQSQKASGQSLVVPFVAGRMSSGTKLGVCTVLDQGIRYGGNLVDSKDTAQFTDSALGCVYADNKNQVKVAEPELVLGYLVP